MVVTPEPPTQAANHLANGEPGDGSIDRGVLWWREAAGAGCTALLAGIDWLLSGGGGGGGGCGCVVRDYFVLYLFQLSDIGSLLFPND